MSGWVAFAVLFFLVQTYPAWPDRWRARGTWLVHGLGVAINLVRRHGLLAAVGALVGREET